MKKPLRKTPAAVAGGGLPPEKSALTPSESLRQRLLSQEAKARKRKKSKPVPAKAARPKARRPAKKKTVRGKAVLRRRLTVDVPKAILAPETPAPPTPVRKDFKETISLPESYGTPRLVLLPRDPYWVHAYWELSPGDRTRFTLKEKGKSSALWLRIYDVTGLEFDGTNALRVFEYEVSPGMESWYAGIPKDNLSLVAEVGPKSEKGVFAPLLRSNEVRTPRAGFSEREDMIWMQAPPEEAPAPLGSAPSAETAGTAASASGVARTTEAVREEARDSISPAHQVDGNEIRFFVREEAVPPQDGSSRENQAARDESSGGDQVPEMTHRRRIYHLTEDDVRDYYFRLFPLLRLILKGRRRKRSGAQIRLESALIEGFSRSRRYRKGASTSGEWQAGDLGASENFVGSSFPEAGGASERLIRHRQFFFELATELIVYGRTEPGACVYYGNRQVPLRPDGTFSMRLALPEGVVPLDFKAQSPDGLDEKRIVTSAERHKTQIL
ncbi:MAG: DUF4912 domain-containing protein [Candidatus Omnitrophica bacterium]|nr:DUF4912 domain-containing protein [Candidatus Omnitrophota bacterium]